MRANIVGRLNMSEEETFYKLKYTSWPTSAQVEELVSTESGRFVLNELASAIIYGIINNKTPKEQDELYMRVQENIDVELDEFFRDAEAGGAGEQYRPDIISDLIELCVLADEIENG